MYIYIYYHVIPSSTFQIPSLDVQGTRQRRSPAACKSTSPGRSFPKLSPVTLDYGWFTVVIMNG